MTRASAIVVAVAMLTTSACGKRKRDEGAEPPPPTAVSPAERKLAADACGDYVTRLCACADKKPELAETCKLKKAKPEAIALALAVADDPSSTPDTVTRAKAEVTKIVARCIEEAAGLPALGCP